MCITPAGIQKVSLFVWNFEPIQLNLGLRLVQELGNNKDARTVMTVVWHVSVAKVVSLQSILSCSILIFICQNVVLEIILTICKVGLLLFYVHVDNSLLIHMVGKRGIIVGQGFSGVVMSVAISPEKELGNSKSPPRLRSLGIIHLTPSTTVERGFKRLDTHNVQFFQNDFCKFSLYFDFNQ